MTETKGRTKGEQLGHRVGQQWRKFADMAEKLTFWLESKGWPRPLVKTLKWLILLIFLLALLYVAFWVALIVVLIIVATRCVGDSAVQTQDWSVGNPDDHKKNVFYDPINYNDPDDPRFDD